MSMRGDLTQGPITRTLLLFALPMMLGNLLQQLYNVADTLIVGRFLGATALAAVGSAFTLMTFLTSILLGLSMGCGAIFSICQGAGDQERLRSSVFSSFVLVAAVTLALNLLVFGCIDSILRLLQVPDGAYILMRRYLWVIFWGLPAVFLYNYFASLLRAVGNSLVPLLFLGTCAVLNVLLDLLFVLGFAWEVAGAAGATVLSQYLSGIGIALYTLFRFPELRPQRQHCRLRPAQLGEIARFSLLTCLQQSVMNFGILMVQATPSLPSWHKTMAPNKVGGFKRAFAARFSRCSFSAWSSLWWSSAWPGRCSSSLSSPMRPKFWPLVWNISALWGPSTGGSAVCFCSTASTAR